jgi:hypothetical protein
MRVASQMNPTQVAKGLGMGKRRLLNVMRRGVLSSLSFTDNKNVRYFDQAWLGKATDIVGGKRGNVTKVGRDLLPQVSSLMLAMVGHPLPYLFYYRSYLLPG